ncbi:SET and MYND domain-containing protein 4-like [Pseudomyrmex gracilis]|uniref:SET and MYND domain-containing protein 4-like n=1 Tax=Pseudomyrmex gracilis TaxID=219809 RepID=UPI000994F40D|nr:SET and MYND domain-containing protein 4-like [Pseudomyrmex gracilis]
MASIEGIDVYTSPFILGIYHDPRTKGFSHDGKMHSDRYISIYSLVTNTEKRMCIELFEISVATALLLYLLATRTAMFGTKLPEDFKLLAKNKDVTFIGGLIMRHMQIFLNNFCIFQEMQGLNYLSYGVAAMPFFSLFNHSCNPNIQICSRAKHAVMHVIYPIKKGEQLLNTYAHYAIYDREARQKKLEGYYFTCDCIPCQENWPLLCHELQSYNILVKKTADKVKIQKALRKLNTYIFITAEDTVQDKPYIIEDLLMMVQVLHECAPMLCLEMFNVIATLTRVYNLIANRFEIPKLWKSEK